MTKYLLVPLPKNPYHRIGPLAWQDWYRQIRLTVKLASAMKNNGNGIVIAILSNFQPKGQLSEIEIYTRLLKKLSPDLDVHTFRETNDTLGQVEKSLELANQMDAQLAFVSTWMHYPRVRYLARRSKAKHYGAFGIPQPAFALIDPFCLIIQPLIDQLGLSKFFQKIIVSRREKGKIL